MQRDFLANISKIVYRFEDCPSCVSFVYVMILRLPEQLQREALILLCKFKQYVNSKACPGSPTTQSFCQFHPPFPYWILYWLNSRLNEYSKFQRANIILICYIGRENVLCFSQEGSTPFYEKYGVICSAQMEYHSRRSIEFVQCTLLPRHLDAILE